MKHYGFATEFFKLKDSLISKLNLNHIIGTHDCPIPKWYRHRFCKECKPMQIGANDEEAKKAAFVLIDRHIRFAAPFEALELEHNNVHRAGVNTGSWVIYVSKKEEES